MRKVKVRAKKTRDFSLLAAEITKIRQRSQTFMNVTIDFELFLMESVRSEFCCPEKYCRTLAMATPKTDKETGNTGSEKGSVGICPATVAG